MVYLRPLAFCLPLALLAGTALSAQHPVSIAHAAESSETGPTGKVSLDVVVTAKSEQPIAGLQQQDFTLLDNKTTPPITAFKAVAESAEDVHVLLIIDAVNTDFTIVANERQRIGNFLKANDGKLAHPTALAIFTDQSFKIQQTYTRDGNALNASLEQETVGLRTLRRSAGFYGAEERTQLSLKTLDELISTERQQPGRKMVIWISPGWPLLSGPAVDLSGKETDNIFHEIVGLSTRLREARITLYSINPLGPGENVSSEFYYQQFTKGVTKPSQADLGHLGLQVLAEQSGGRASLASNDVAGMLKRAVADADAFYELTFEAPKADHSDEYHQVEVRVNRPGLTARTEQGYYDQP